jgi:hypothetical protein
MANLLPREKRLAAIRLLVEGNSIRSITRITGIHRTTVMNLLVEFGEDCRQFLQRGLSDLHVQHVECDEIWTFVRKKHRQLSETEKLNSEWGDRFLFLALDADSKLICTYALGKRDSETTERFVDDLAPPDRAAGIRPRGRQAADEHGRLARLPAFALTPSGVAGGIRSGTSVNVLNQPETPDGRAQRLLPNSFVLPSSAETFTFERPEEQG